MLELPVDALLLTAARIGTFDGDRPLTNASGFFFERNDALFLVTSRHVFLDAENDHHPNRIEIEIHRDRADLAQALSLSVLLFADGKSLWRSAQDAGGEIDVAMLSIDRSALPAGHLLRAFRPADLQRPDAPLRIGHPLSMVFFFILTAVTFSLLGFVIGVWADNFEKLQLVPLLIVTPLTFLGGSFYSINMLPPFWQAVTLFNPVVYLISGFRWSFYGVADVPVWISLAMTGTFLAAFIGIATWMLRTGYRLKN